MATSDHVLSPLQFSKPIFDFALHPSENIAVTGLINGKIHCHRYGAEGHELLWSVRPTKKSCRGLRFNMEATGLYSISKDRSLRLIDLETGKTVHEKLVCHENPPNALLCLNERLLATGDDQGVIKIWDNRKEDAIMTYTEHEDFIADMTFRADKRTLVAVGGDGYLSTWDIRKKDVAAMSDHMEDELLSVVLVKNGNKAVVGSQHGILSIWTWGDWGDYSDRITGHPSSVDALCKLDEDTVCTGSSDGLIRLVSILPNRFEGILGDHGEDMPIEHLRLDHSKKYLLSSGHDNAIRFWDIGHLFEEDDDEEEEGKEEEKTEEKEGKAETQVAENPVETVAAAAEEKTKDTKDESDSDSDSDSDEEEEKANKSKRKLPQKKPPMTNNKKHRQAASFFADL